MIDLLFNGTWFVRKLVGFFLVLIFYFILFISTYLSYIMITFTTGNLYLYIHSLTLRFFRLPSPPTSPPHLHEFCFHFFTSSLFSFPFPFLPSPHHSPSHLNMFFYFPISILHHVPSLSFHHKLLGLCTIQSHSKEHKTYLEHSTSGKGLRF